MEQIICPKCKTAILKTSIFCPQCGHQIQYPQGISTGKQLGIYLLSFFLPPLGLIPGIKYIKSTDQSVKKVGIIAISLTLASIFISLISVGGLLAVYASILKDLSNFRSY